MRKLIKKEKMKKQLVIGDIHGCYKEFQALLEVSCLTKEDEIIALGDIVDRGPASPEILNFFRNNAGARVIKGNHERKHIRSFQGKTKAALSQQITRSQIGEKDYSNAISFMDSFVNFIELPEVILTHGFFEPGIPLSFQKEMVINGTMSGDVYLRENYKRPWYELYDGDKPVIVGHLNYSGTDNPFIYKDRVFCIDTGCCRGGKLTGVLLPEFKIISVKSEKDYWKEIKNSYIENRLSSTSDELMSWDDIEKFLVNNEKETGMSGEIYERILKLKKLFSIGENDLMKLFNLIVKCNEQILTELKIKHSYDILSPGQQGKLYAEYIEKMKIKKLGNFIHKFRRGNLTLKDLRYYFKKPKDVRDFLNYFCKNSIIGHFDSLD